MPKIENFEDLLKRGNLPDDDRVVPNWLKIKNEQFEDVDFSNNRADDIVQLSSEEFNEFVSILIKDNYEGMLLTYITTLDEIELQRFYTYLEGVKLDESMDAPNAKEQFQSAIQNVNSDEITDTQKARATLEIPLYVNYAKAMYHKTLEFKAYISQGYYNYEAEDEFKVIEGYIVKILWENMSYIPDHTEQILDYFKGFYDESNEDHQKFAKHLAKRFGGLIIALNILVQLTQERKDTSLDWFTNTFMVGQDRLDGFELYKNDKLAFYLTNMFMAICDENDDAYLSSLISCVKCLFEYYPQHDEACHYAMVEMMKSVAMKAVSVKNANRFLAFFEELPRFYEEMSYWKIYHLKELINHTLANYKPQDNKIFDEYGVKHKMVLLNYLVDMEDIYYEGTDMAKREKRHKLSLREYVKLFEPFRTQQDLENAGLWGYPVTIDKNWDRYDEIIKDKETGVIGWEYPVTGDIFNMHVEIPVVFEKTNSDSLGVGVPLELVELKSKKEEMI